MDGRARNLQLVRDFWRGNGGTRAPEEAQEVAVLYFVDELTQAEIAQELSRSLPTVRKRLREFLSCARAALQEAMPGVVLPEGDEL